VNEPAVEATLLAIDCGTQSLRAMLFSAAGRLLDRSQVPYEPYVGPCSGWAEQDPEVYWGALCAAARTLQERSVAPFARIQGVGVAALRNTPVLVDPAGNPLRPAILWLDSRKAGRVYRPGWAARLAFAATGLLPVLETAQEDCKTSWVRQHQPETWARAARVLQVSGFLNHRLTGRFRDSVASQAGHLPFHYRDQRWCRPGELGAMIFPVEPGKLPELVAPAQPIGVVSRTASEATGIPQGLPVIACASDKGAESLGTGCVRETMASLSLGTAATVQTTSQRYFEPLAGMPAYPAALAGHYSPEVQVFRGYWLIRWFLREFGIPERERALALGVPPESLLDRFLLDVPPGSLGLMTWPHWSAPLRDPAARGSMIGLGEAHTRGHVYRSFIEGLGFALREGLERIERAGRVRIERIGLAGGAAQSEAICQITADAMGRSLCAGETFEAGGLGAAVLTAAGIGLYPGAEAAVRAMVRTGRTYLPRPETADLYGRLYRDVHLPMGRRLRPLHRRIRAILGDPGGCPGTWAASDRRQMEGGE
jgi:sugar (pentulose or hexulose) kinase